MQHSGEVRAHQCTLALCSLKLLEGGYETVLDIFLSMPQDIAKKCRVTVREANEMLDMASSAITKVPRRLSDIAIEPNCFTTGDETLDKILGGGIRTGMVWEIVGEGCDLDYISPYSVY